MNSNKFKVGDKVIFVNKNYDIYGAIGTISQVSDYYVLCEDWSIPLNRKTRYFNHISEIELANPYLQRQEAKKLLGLK